MMARAVTCDNCGKERPPASHLGDWVGWLEVKAHNFESYGGGPWDFCSLACLTSWAAEAGS